MVCGRVGKSGAARPGNWCIGFMWAGGLSFQTPNGGRRERWRAEAHSWSRSGWSGGAKQEEATWKGWEEKGWHSQAWEEKGWSSSGWSSWSTSGWEGWSARDLSEGNTRKLARALSHYCIQIKIFIRGSSTTVQVLMDETARLRTLLEEKKLYTYAIIFILRHVLCYETNNYM